MKMIEDYKRGNNDCKPDVISLNTVINAYANRGDVKQAERILSLMSDGSFGGDVRPNTETYNVNFR